MYKESDKMDVDVSKKILDYKDGGYRGNSFSIFTRELMKAVTMIANSCNADRIGLVAVPSSRIGKKSTIIRSIGEIITWYNIGSAEKLYKCRKQLFDHSELLARTDDVSPSHLGNRATSYDHMRTISCRMDHLSDLMMDFIIIDDVTTTGASMDACRTILAEHGVRGNKILRLAIAKTVREEKVKDG